MHDRGGGDPGQVWGPFYGFDSVKCTYNVIVFYSDSLTFFGS